MQRVPHADTDALLPTRAPAAASAASGAPVGSRRTARHNSSDDRDGWSVVQRVASVYTCVSAPLLLAGVAVLLAAPPLPLPDAMPDPATAASDPCALAVAQAAGVGPLRAYARFSAGAEALALAVLLAAVFLWPWSGDKAVPSARATRWQARAFAVWLALDAVMAARYLYSAWWAVAPDTTTIPPDCAAAYAAHVDATATLRAVLLATAGVRLVLGALLACILCVTTDPHADTERSR